MVRIPIGANGSVMWGGGRAALTAASMTLWKRLKWKHALAFHGLQSWQLHRQLCHEAVLGR
jgi:hypothetical protein